MARLLGLDWDHNQLHLIVASTSLTRGSVVVEKTLIIDAEGGPTVAGAEALGLKLKQRLKDEKISPAPVVACVGRDRVILKEIRHPKVPQKEEAALVRFQAAKELTEAPETMILDYVPVPGVAGGECRAQVFATRKDVPAALQQLCKAAGLKLAALTPRTHGLAVCVKKESHNTTVAVVALGERWAEFCVVRDGRLLFSRPLSQGPGLLGDLKRNLTVFNGQTTASSNVQTIFVVGSDDKAPLAAQMKEMLACPVRMLVDVTPLVGLLDGWAHDKSLPINFVKPREAKPDIDPNRNRNYVVAAACVFLFVAAIVGGRIYVAVQAAQLEELALDSKNLDDRLAVLAPDARSIDALKKWNQNAVPWADELYETTAHFPFKEAMYVKSWSGTQRAGKAAGKDKTLEKFVGQINLVGEVRRADSRLVNQFTEKLIADGTHRVLANDIAGAGQGNAKEGVEFSMKIDLLKQESNAYQTVFTAPPRTILEKQAPSSKKGSQSKKTETPTAAPAAPALEQLDGGEQP